MPLIPTFFLDHQGKAKSKMFSLKNILSNLLVYGTTHAMIDGVCAAVIYSILKNQAAGSLDLMNFIILYNVLAFGLQAVFGLASDYFKSPRMFAVLGCILTALATLIFLKFPILAIICAGLGNALFHVGAGSISLNLTPRKAAAPGIYVAPGALGLLVGTIIGKNGELIAWPVIVIMAALSFFALVIKMPTIDYKQEETVKNKISSFEFIFLLVFLSIAIRSLVGMVLIFPWKTDINLLIVMTLAIVFGKGIGGLLADKFGWIRIAVGALVCSIPLLVFGSNNPYLAITGIFLFNITMPITLVAISNVLPGRPGFAFGLTCLALILGALPALTGYKKLMEGQLFVFLIIFISAIALFYALRAYSKNYPGEKNIY